MTSRTAAIVTVGSELTHGLRVDTNTAEVARSLTPRGFTVTETVSVADDELLLAGTLGRLIADNDLVVTTGGLGPTHDDVTRTAASIALDRPLVVDQRLVERLRPVVARHADPLAAAQVFTQAEVFEGAEVIDATTGTAPGLLIPTSRGTLALLPGPPSEMRPMLATLAERYPLTRAQTRDLGVTGIGESDVQVIVQRALEGAPGIGFTVLAKPGDVRVILVDDGAGPDALTERVGAVTSALGPACYSVSGETLAETVIAAATGTATRLATAESCTGGMVAAALTDVAGSSRVFLGSVVSYDNSVKSGALGVSEQTLVAQGAVSADTAEQMARGVARLTGADLAIAITGIAGPDGGTVDKPVGTVWFGLCAADGNAGDTEVTSFVRHFISGSRDSVRARATAVALDALRRRLLGLESLA